MTEVTIAIPVRNGLPRLSRVLEAISTQRTSRDFGVLVCDSGSTDESVAVCRLAGADLIFISPTEFSHGGTRNLLFQRAAGEIVVFLTQDAKPANSDWLERLLSGFDMGPDVALTFGPYEPMADASLHIRRELSDWFGSLSPDGRPRIDRLRDSEYEDPLKHLVGRRGFFTDANGAVRRDCWEKVPYRPVPYAEDQQLAVDMLAAGFAKVYVPGAAVEHSHDYPPLEQLRRSFDEGRGLHEVYGWREPAHRLTLRDRVLIPARADGRALRSGGASFTALLSGTARSVVHHTARTFGGIAGTRADRVPAALRRLLSLEGRG